MITLPTLWGWLVITILMTLLIYTIFQYLGGFLAKNQPVQSQYLIVEGWLGEPALLDAKTIFEQGQYQLLITSGGPDKHQIRPDYPSYAEAAAIFLIKQGLNGKRVKAVPAPDSAQDRTYLSAVKVRNWLQQQGIQPTSLNVVSYGVHARRSQQLYQQAFGDTVDIGIIALSPTPYSLQHWWRSSDGVKSVLAEIIGLTYAFCCFHPGEPGSHQELWGSS